MRITFWRSQKKPQQIILKGERAVRYVAASPAPNSVSKHQRDNDHRVFLPMRAFGKVNNTNYSYNGSFHEAIAPILLMAQLFGILPVCGIQCVDPAGLKFKWRSFRAIYAVIVTGGLLFMSGATLYWLFARRIEFGKIIPTIFYITNVIVMLLFLRLAQKWRGIVLQWHEVEINLPQLRTFFDTAKLAQRLKLVTITVMSLSLAEHLLAVVSGLHYSSFCVSNPTRAFFLAELSQWFSVIDYSVAAAVIGKYINVVATFSWTFMDLFVMLISISLATRFKQINDYLMIYKGKIAPEVIWKQQRRNYRNICDLTTTMDDAMAMITLISFSNNLFFVCVQLMRSLSSSMGSYSHVFYFWFSLLFLIGRTLAVSLYSAQINDESKKLIDIFRAVPHTCWGLQVQRFSQEVTADIIALSGMKFFYLTRSLILSVVGTIITYEMVLLQFHEDDQVSDLKTCF